MSREFVKIVGRFFTTKDLDIFVLNAEKREWKEGKENGGRVMGVYIPTWRKPNDCLGCPFHQSYEDGTISCELPESSPDDCKMVDVKAPHGHRTGGRVMDLIDREETLKAMDTWDKFGCDENYRLIPLRGIDENSYVPYVHYDDMVKAVKGMPSAQKTGKWIVHTEIKNVYGGIYIECSECGESYVVQHLDAEIFCRTCGSKNGR